MAIPTITPYSGGVANPDGSQTQTEFTQNMFDQLSYEAALAHELNNTVSEMNAVAGQVDTNAAIAQNSADAAQAAANFEGEFVVGVTSAEKGKSYLYNGNVWLCLQNTTATPSTGNAAWKISVGERYVTEAQEDFLPPGSSLFKGNDGVTVKDGDTVPAGTTHLRVLVGGEPKLVSIFAYVDSASVVSNITNTSIELDSVEVPILLISETVEVSVDAYLAVSASEHDAFVNAASAINATGGGRLIVPKKKDGTPWLVGKQTINPSPNPSEPYYQNDGPAMDLQNCSGVIIDLYGEIKLNDGLRFGSFDPLTGVASGSIQTGGEYAAQIGHVLNVESCSNVQINNFNADGNLSNLIIGGKFGDTGWQTQSIGLRIFNSRNVICNNPITHHFAMDGIYTGSSPSNGYLNAHIILNNPKSYGNGRQGHSHTGGVDLALINPEYFDTGKDGLFSLPGAGLDIETNGGIVSGVTIINPRIYNNTGSGLLALNPNDTSNIRVYGGVLAASGASRALWDQVGMTLFDVDVRGSIATTADLTRFINCKLNDLPYDTYPTPTENIIENVAGLCRFDNCEIDYYGNGEPFIQGGELYNCKYTARLTDPAVRTRVGVLRPEYAIDMLITSEYTFTSGNTGVDVDGEHTYVDTSFSDGNFKGDSRIETDNIALGGRLGDTNVYLDYRITRKSVNSIVATGSPESIDIPVGVNIVSVKIGATAKAVFIQASRATSNAASHGLTKLTEAGASEYTIELVANGDFDSIVATEVGSTLAGKTIEYTITSLDSIRSSL